MKYSMKVSWTLFIFMCTCFAEKKFQNKLPTVGISVLVRNKAHILPYFFSSLYNLDYPKDRIYLWYVQNIFVNRLLKKNKNNVI